MAVSRQEQGHHAHQEGTRSGLSQAQGARDRSARLTLSGSFLGIAITASLFALLFSPYWLILAGFAAVGFTQSWGFDLARIEQDERRRQR